MITLKKLVLDHSYRLKNGNKYRRPSAAPTVMLCPPSTAPAANHQEGPAAKGAAADAPPTPTPTTNYAVPTPTLPMRGGSVRLAANGHNHHHHGLGGHRGSNAKRVSVKNKRKRSTDRTTRYDIKERKREKRTKRPDSIFPQIPDCSSPSSSSFS